MYCKINTGKNRIVPLSLFLIQSKTFESDNSLPLTHSLTLTHTHTLTHSHTHTHTHRSDTCVCVWQTHVGVCVCVCACVDSPVLQSLGSQPSPSQSSTFHSHPKQGGVIVRMGKQVCVSDMCMYVCLCNMCM